MLAYPQIQCPFCWERLTIELDLSVAGQSYIEDCQVCCQPMVISYECADGEVVNLTAEQDNA